MMYIFHKICNYVFFVLKSVCSVRGWNKNIYVCMLYKLWRLITLINNNFVLVYIMLYKSLYIIFIYNFICNSCMEHFLEEQSLCCSLVQLQLI